MDSAAACNAAFFLRVAVFTLETETVFAVLLLVLEDKDAVSAAKICLAGTNAPKATPATRDSWNLEILAIASPSKAGQASNVSLPL
nr:hypothetical protein [Acetobacter ghanensis]